ncbi:MAG: glycosyltransferase family 4 protein [Bacteroidota bacterium]
MIRLYNTFEIAVPIWDYLVPALESRGKKVELVVSKGIYRKERTSQLSKYHHYVWVPGFLKKNKKFCHLFYVLLVPFKILFNRQTELNIFYTQPPFFYMFAGWLSYLRGTPFIIHIMDLQPEMLGALGKLNKKGWVYRMTERWGTWALKKADKVIVIGDCMKDLMLSKGIAADRIDIIRNISSNESNEVVEKSHNPFVKKHGLNDQFIILYSGNMGLAHEFDTILKVSERLRHLPDLLFLFIGRGARRPELENYVAQHQPKNIQLMGFLPIEDLPYSLGAADVHFISLRDGMEGVMVPSKFYGCLLSGKAIIFEGHPNSEISRELDRSDCGQQVNHLDEMALEAAILHYYQHRNQVVKQGRNGQLAYQQKYASSHFAANYLEILEREEALVHNL